MFSIPFDKSIIFPDCKVYKIHKWTGIDNNRLVALTSVFSKIIYIYIYCFLDTLILFFGKCYIISNKQFGYRQGKSTKHAIEIYINKVMNSLESGERPVVVFCDISKAFNTNHTTLGQTRMVWQCVEIHSIQENTYKTRFRCAVIRS